jgi:hypothetical protein
MTGEGEGSVEEHVRAAGDTGLPETRQASPSPTALKVAGALRTAAQVSGVPFDYLVRTAMRESSLNPSLKASTSTATGLFQMLEQTWLGLLDEEGAKFGYGQYADAIERVGPGRYRVADPALRAEIMALREDPVANAVIGGGAFTRMNERHLTRALGRQPSERELYVAHFFGPGQAARFLSILERAPQTNVAEVFPRAAEANRPIFYDRQGEARTAREVYEVLTKRHGGPLRVPESFRVAMEMPAGPAAIEAATRTAVRERPAQAPVQGPVHQGPVLAFAEPGRAPFAGLFRTDMGAPVSPGVRELWGPRGLGETRAMREQADLQPLDLARFRRAT